MSSIADLTSAHATQSQQLIKPPLIRVTKVIRHTLDNDQSTIFQCKALQLHGRTQSTAVLPAVRLKNKRGVRLDATTSQVFSDAYKPQYSSSKPASNEFSFKLTRVKRRLLTSSLSFIAASRSSSIIRTSTNSPSQSTSKPNLSISNINQTSLQCSSLKPTSRCVKARVSQKHFSFASLPKIKRAILKNPRPANI